ncbi:MAG: ATP-dependent Clp protease proteolytic subunit [Clostridia bacterium]
MHFVIIEHALIEGGIVSDYFYLNDLKQRKLFINEDIEMATIDEIVKHILQYNSNDVGLEAAKRDPILLYVTSNGGEVDAGFELIDVILNSKTPVYTINLGYWYSMGFLIGIAGHKRYASQHSKYLMHDGANFVYNSGAKAQDQMQFNRRVEEKVKQYILSRSSITSEEYDSKLRVEWYMFSDEAKAKGFIDHIIGVDCDIDEII